MNAQANPAIDVPNLMPRVKQGQSSSSSNLAVMKKILFGTLGIVFIGIAVAGVVLPGVPTTGPLIAASCLLAKSNQRLQGKLLGLRIFRRYRHYLDGSSPLPLRARLIAMGWMWISILASCCLLSRSEQSSILIIGSVLAAGGVGTAVILLFRRSATTRPVNRILDCTHHGQRAEQGVPIELRLHTARRNAQSPAIPRQAC